MHCLSPPPPVSFLFLPVLLLTLLLMLAAHPAPALDPPPPFSHSHLSATEIPFETSSSCHFKATGLRRYLFLVWYGGNMWSHRHTFTLSDPRE